jgi:hypothetical protein
MSRHWCDIAIFVPENGKYTLSDSLFFDDVGVPTTVYLHDGYLIDRALKNLCIYRGFSEHTVPHSIHDVQGHSLGPTPSHIVISTLSCHQWGGATDGEAKVNSEAGQIESQVEP